jgi:four helix bundle protein
MDWQSGDSGHTHDPLLLTGPMGDFKRLLVWKAAEQLVSSTYAATSNLPDSERYGLVSQMRRAACSIAANIAEGCGRLGDAELARFVRIAAGSAAELESHVLLARKLHFLKSEVADPLLLETERVQKQLYRLNASLRAPSRPAMTP